MICKYNKDMEPYVGLIIIIIVALLLGGLYAARGRFPNVTDAVNTATQADANTRGEVTDMDIGERLKYCMKANRGTVAATTVWLILSIVTLFLIGYKDGDKTSMFFLEFILMIVVPAAVALRGAMKPPSGRNQSLKVLKSLYPDLPDNPTEEELGAIRQQYEGAIQTAQVAMAALDPNNANYESDRSRLQKRINRTTISGNRVEAAANAYIAATSDDAPANGEQCTEFLTTDFLKIGGLIVWILTVVTTLVVLWGRSGNPQANVAISSLLIMVVPFIIWYRGAKSGQSGGARGDGDGVSSPPESKIAQAGLFSLAAALVALGGVFLVKEASKSEMIGAAAKYIAYAGAGGIGAIVLYRLFKKYSGSVSLSGVESLMEGVPFGVKFLLLELLAVSAVIAYPTARRKLITIAMPRGSKVFLGDPVPLDTATTVDTFSDLTGTLAKSYPYSPMYNYSVGGWFFFDNVSGNGPLSKTTGYIPVLDFGGSPLITFNPATGYLKVIAEIAGGGKVTLYDDSVPLQRWNNVVVTFNKGTADVLINNTLVGTRKNTTPMQTRGPMTVGYKIPGESSIRGGVTNVFFTPKPMNKFISGLNFRIMAPTEGV
tara:strand:+ start:704 stop:2506 length:1803 start_codon:yes stop_codon:yes gene_type:complete